MAAGATYEPIATTTLNAVTASVTFSSIPATYTDLQLVVVANGTWTSTTYMNLDLQFNSDTGNNYSNTELGGDGSSPWSTYNSGLTVAPMGYLYVSNTNTTQFSLSIANIMSYSSTSTRKSLLYTGNNDMNGSGAVSKGVAFWQSNAVISTIKVMPDSGSSSFRSGSTFTLYGIASA